MKAAAVVLFLVLAGCTAPPEAEEGPLTAKAAAPQALAAAQAWSREARVVSVGAIELATTGGAADEGSSPGSGSPGASGDDASEADPFGIGRPDAWTFRFLAQDKPGLLLEVVLDDEGAHEHVREVDPHFDSEPVERWRVDSDEAVASMRRANTSMDRLLSERGADLILELTSDLDPAHPTWLLGVFVQEGRAIDVSYFVVEADTGRYVGSYTSEEFVDAVLVPAEHGKALGTLDVLNAEAQHPFALEEHDHDALAVRVVASSALPATEVRLMVAGPDGSTREQTVNATQLGEDALVIIEKPSMGGWSATIGLEAGALVSWELFWCGDGTYVRAPGQDHDCDVAFGR